MFRVVALVVISLLVVIGAWVGEPQHEQLAGQLIRTTLERVLTQLIASAKETPVRVALDAGNAIPGFQATTPALLLDERIAREIAWVPPDAPAERADHTIRLRLESSPHSVTLHYVVDDTPERVRRFAWYAVLPPLLAIVTAILFRHVIICLVLGILAGGVIAVWPTDHSPVYGLWYAFREYFVRHALQDEWRLEITAFVVLITATVGLARESGGIQGLVNAVIRYCRTARSARLGTVIAGLLVFFDDYLNCIIVGNTLRPLTDRYRVSREKLAYIVDSTAAPLAGLAVFSTWIAFEVSQIGEGLGAANRGDLEPFAMFVRTLPTRFYCIFTLFFVLALAWMGRDYGPMLSAERKAASRPRTPDDAHDGASSSGHKDLARYAVVPIGVTLLATLVGLWWSGWNEAGKPSVASLGLWAYMRELLGKTDSMWAFSRASGLGFLIAVGMVAGTRIMSPARIARTSLSSVRLILSAVAILFLAWSLGGACTDVGTAAYLVALFREVISPVGFSAVVFTLSCLVAFATGSSYSTMAILLPNVVPLAFEVGEASTLTGLGLTTIAIGAVLDGAIFGDHCSPISDTTILSALSSECDTIEHVRTQMPYALTGMAVALLAGYIPVALGIPPYLSWVAGAGAILIVIRLAGKKIDESTHTRKAVVT